MHFKIIIIINIFKLYESNKIYFFKCNLLFNSTTIQLILSSDPLSIAVSTIVLAISSIFLFWINLEISSGLKTSQTPSEAKTQ